MTLFYPEGDLIDGRYHAEVVALLTSRYALDQLEHVAAIFVHVILGIELLEEFVRWEFHFF